jgi:hypothetical protein
MTAEKPNTRMRGAIASHASQYVRSTGSWSMLGIPPAIIACTAANGFTSPDGLRDKGAWNVDG